MSTTTQEPHQDPWTPDQELTLLKALVKFKPVGLHAHFRMLSIHAYLQNSGTCTAEDEHTRIPGIWVKLRTLYDLERLDEREDAVITSVAADDNDDDGSTLSPSSSSQQQQHQQREHSQDRSYWRDFELPRDDGVDGDFEKLMWERRLAPEGTPGSPEWSTNNTITTGGDITGRGARRESTVAGTDEPRSSPVAGSVTRGTRGGRRGGRVSRLKGEAEVSEGRRSRRESKTASEVGTKDEDGDENMEDAESEEESGDGSEDDDDDSEEPDEDEKRAGPAKRGRGGRRGRGRRGRRRG